jgi:hypothetical protein
MLLQNRVSNGLSAFCTDPRFDDSQRAGTNDPIWYRSRSCPSVRQS